MDKSILLKVVKPVCFSYNISEIGCLAPPIASRLRTFKVFAMIRCVNHFHQERDLIIRVQFQTGKLMSGNAN